MDLSALSTIQANNFVKIVILDGDTLLFSDYHRSFTTVGDTYSGLGSLMGIGDVTSELRTTADEITISVAGIPTSVIAAILDSKITGAAITIKRAFFNPTTGVLIDTANNPMIKFSGIITNYALQDEVATATSQEPGTVMLVFTAASSIEVLGQKITGRRTNPQDQKRFYPDDVSMDRVPTIAGSSINFGGSQ